MASASGEPSTSETVGAHAHTTGAVDTWVDGIWLCFLLIAAVWLGCVFYFPTVSLRGQQRAVRLNGGFAENIPLSGPAAFKSKVPQDPPLELSGGLVRLLSPLGHSLPAGTEIRFEPLRGNNLDIYLRNDEFESIPYPDRDRFVGRLGGTWCADHSKYFLPTVRIRDIRSGRTMASYNCFAREIVWGR